MTDNIQKKAITIKKTVLRFTDSAVPYAWEKYDPAQIEEQPDGSLLVTLYGAIEFKIVNLVLTECGRVQVVNPPELAEKVVEPKQTHSTPLMASGALGRIWQMAVTPVRLMPMERYMPRLPVSWLV